MTKEETRLKVRGCLAFMVRGGLRRTLFENTPLVMVKEMQEAEVLPEKLDISTACAAVKEFRYEFAYLKDLNDTVQEIADED